MSKIKICGLTREEDIDAVNEARPDYAGFVLWPNSRRCVTAQQALRLRKRLAPGIVPVGVFVDAEIDFIERLHDNRVIKIAQLHGQEDEAYIRKLQACCGIPVIKALVGESAIAEGLCRSTAADFLLLDSGRGSGRPFDWSLLRHVRRPYFLAGGVGPENIDAALQLAPFGVDISSGVETNGLKDRDKIIALTTKVRNFS